jgi:hypothetical protein
MLYKKDGCTTEAKLPMLFEMREAHERSSSIQPITSETREDHRTRLHASQLDALLRGEIIQSFFKR